MNYERAAASETDHSEHLTDKQYHSASVSASQFVMSVMDCDCLCQLTIYLFLVSFYFYFYQLLEISGDPTWGHLKFLAIGKNKKTY